MGRKRIWMALTVLAALLALPFTAQAYSPGEEAAINFPRLFLPFDATNVSFEMTGGQVFVSNAPETINEDGALREDGSVITGQYNATLYRDTVTGAFRFWGSHYNKTTRPLKFWVHVHNPSHHDIRFYVWNEAYSDGPVTAAASEVTRTFMDTTPQKRLLATIPAGDSYYFSYSDEDHVAVNESVVYFAQFSAESAVDGSDADVLVSHVVTTTDVVDPTPYATTATIARTNATATKSDDYRGLLQHWGRIGTLEATLTDANPFFGLKLGDLGYSGEQEPLLTRWNVFGQAVEQQEVRFVTPTLNKLRQAYWYIDYDMHIRLHNETGFPTVHTLYGSNGSNPGFVNYQLNGGPANNYHFSRNTAVPVTTETDYRLRMMVMPSSSLPFGLYFAAGDESRVPDEIAVYKAEHTLAAADADQAEAIVNALPAGAEREQLAARLALVRQYIAATDTVSAAEQQLQGVEAALQAADLAVKGKKERKALLQQLDDAARPAGAAASAAETSVAALPDSGQPALQAHLDSLRARVATVQGRLDSIRTIARMVADPGNQYGSVEISQKVRTGQEIRLADIVEAEPDGPLVQGDPLTWVSGDRSIAPVTPDGVLTPARSGVVVVYGYNSRGVLVLLLNIRN